MNLFETAGPGQKSLFCYLELFGRAQSRLRDAPQSLSFRPKGEILLLFKISHPA
jgi:hypothetical protein